MIGTRASGPKSPGAADAHIARIARDKDVLARTVQELGELGVATDA